LKKRCIGKDFGETPGVSVRHKSADAVAVAEVKSGQQGIGILHAEANQLRQGVGTSHLANRSGRRRDEP
jgi:hypothetical protein